MKKLTVLAAISMALVLAFSGCSNSSDGSSSKNNSSNSSSQTSGGSSTSGGSASSGGKITSADQIVIEDGTYDFKMVTVDQPKSSYADYMPVTTTTMTATATVSGDDITYIDGATEKAVLDGSKISASYFSTVKKSIDDTYETLVGKKITWDGQMGYIETTHSSFEAGLYLPTTVAKAKKELYPTEKSSLSCTQSGGKITTTYEEEINITATRNATITLTKK